MSNAGIALRVIPEISSHSNLEELQRYLEVRRKCGGDRLVFDAFLHWKTVLPYIPDRQPNEFCTFFISCAQTAAETSFKLVNP
jgi:predicted deacetylase